MKKFKTWAPLFSGFYESIWDIDTDYYEDKDGNRVDYDRLIIDFEGYKNEVGKRFCQWLPSLFPKGMIGAEEYETIVSPKYYNFETDSINCTLEVDTVMLAKYLQDNWEAFCKDIKDRYTSCSGFISWHSNDAEDWKIETQNFQDFEEEEHKLGAILQFIALNEDDNAEDVIFDLVAKYEFQDNYIEVKEWEWEELSTEELTEAIKEHADKIDFNYGYGKLLVQEAKHKAEIFGTSWQGELQDSDKINFLSSTEITPKQIKTQTTC